LPDGAIVTGNRNGDGVRISGGGKFTMTGGEISDNEGNGVKMTGGVFVMTGGEIARNVFKGVKIDGGEFTKTGGTVHGKASKVGSNGNGKGSINFTSGNYGPTDDYLK
jgi:hypothetical protein